VNFLVDVNLPPQLCLWVKSRHHQAEHLFERNLLTATDSAIWELGKVENLTIVSKDVDFYERALLYGPPPQIIHVGLGNCSNARLFDFLAGHWDHIERALTSGSSLVALTSDKIEVFA
jgi:predicted nuclease of predicted toxin-antitoxin system